MRMTIAAISMMAALMAGCASGPKLRVDQDPSANMSAYKTFGFYDQSSTDRARYSTIMTSHLKQATRAQMERHGYTYSEANPDLRVNFFISVIDKQELRSTGAYRPYLGWRGAPVETVEYRKGTLSIDLVDTSRNALVWQGVAEGRVNEKTAQDPGATITEAVSEIFAGFPSSGSGGQAAR